MKKRFRNTPAMASIGLGSLTSLLDLISFIQFVRRIIGFFAGPRTLV